MYIFGEDRNYGERERGGMRVWNAQTQAAAMPQPTWWNPKRNILLSSLSLQLQTNRIEYSRDGLFEDVVRAVSGPLVCFIKDPGSALEEALQLLIFTVFQNLCHVPQDAVHLPQHHSV